MGLLAAVAAPGPAAAQFSPWAKTERGGVRLISATTGVGQAPSLDIGVEFALAPGWKTYWRLPGESGMPPQFSWDGSANLGRAEVAWPSPHRFSIAGMESYGYEGRVILPVRIALTEPGAAVTVRLHIRYAMCLDVCVPEEARLAMVVPAGDAATTDHAAAIARHAEAAAKPGQAWGWRIARADLVRADRGPHAGSLKLVVEAVADALPFTAPDLVAEGQGVRFGLSAITVGEAGRNARFVLPLRRGSALSPPSGPLTVTLFDGKRQGRFEVTVSPPP